MGASVPLIISWIYLGLHHAIAPFLYQVFKDISAKGTLYSITLGKIVELFQAKFYGIMGVLCAFAVYIISTKINKKNSNASYISVLEKVLIVLSALFFCYYYAGILIEAWKVSMVTGLVLLLLMQCVVGFCASPTAKVGRFGILAVLCLTAVILIINPNNATVTFYTTTSIFSYMADLLNLIFVFLMMWNIFHVFWCKITRETPDLKALVVASAGIASGFTSMMSNGEAGVVTISAHVIIPAFIYIIFRDKKVRTFFPARILQVSLLFIVGICMTNKLVCNYSWWGDAQAPFWEKTEYSDIDKLAGIKFSKREKNKIEGLCKLIDYYTNENSVIWGFPHVKLYNYLLDNYHMNGFVPVEFYDVCADDYAIYEAELLAGNEPDIVVWADMPNCMEVHEMVYRNGGRLGQRQIQKWFSEVKDTDYTLIGQVDNVFVYKLNDDTDITYTYIEHQAVTNQTAVYDDSIESINIIPECTLSGSGTVDQPYLISTASDMKTFRDLVNSGMSFDGQYIRQTADIDLSSYNNWEPIGRFESNNLFAGNYDGDGYLIKGLCINNPNENVALFGQLAGTVMNVSVIDCDVTGSCIGGIASHGIGPVSKIINCKVTGALHSYGRAGGIADNLGGTIINCVTDVNLSGKLASGISGYYTNTITNCYSRQGTGAFSMDHGMQYGENMVDELNNALRKLEEEYDQQLNEWTIIDGEVRLTHKE